MRPQDNHDHHDVLTADRDERRELRDLTSAEKDDRLRRLGWNPHEHPLAGPCRWCGYERRYAAFPFNCLFCEAFNG